ncbi:piwi-like protein Siwi [Sitodiplosis mosellana]|uniref:piwi-like protein Siwi n=1 Tax=Sitodiplosis mosellana TaxID=263140 RepID=UPI00244443E7|nr:piwi-like protein Siwi [Sitodiplosis mosellana]
MSQPRGKGGNPGRNGKPANQGGNAWGNQGRGDGRPQNQRPQGNQNQAPPNFADPNAFGPPLGGRARPNRNPDAAASASRAPPASTSRGPPPSVSQPQQPSGNTQAVKPSAWGQSKKSGETDSSGSSTKPQSVEKTRVGAPRGAIRGDRSEQSLALVETKPGHVASKKGNSGRVFNVKANYFALNSKIKWQVFHYHVEFTPEVENPAFKNLLLAQQRPRIGNFLYDRGSSIFTVRQLESERFEISTRDRDQNEILIKFSRVGLISPLEMRFIQLLNIIMKKAFKELNLQRVSRDYFDADARIVIRQHNIELWPGYTTSIRQHEKNLLMMAEIKHKLMRTETLLDVLRRCYTNNRNNYQQAFQQEVLGMIVLTRYNNKTYRISDVIFDVTPAATFDTRDGPKSYIDYYKTKHGLQITDPGQPLLRSTPTERDIRGARGREEEARPINLIPELCTPTGYTDEMRRNFNLMKDVAIHTRVGPGQRIQKLIAFNNRLQSTPTSIACLRDWDLDLDRDLVDVPARQLPAEEIQLGQNAKVRADHQASWTNALQGRNSMFSSERLADKQWAVVVPQSLQRDGQAFIQCLRDVSNGMAFQVGEPQIVNVPDDRATTLSNVLEQICNQNKKMIVIMVSNNQADRYSIIKKVCSVRHAVPSQVVTRRVMDSRDMRKMRSVATKVAIQINSKIGGMPWAVDVKLSNCMFIGYDVCHDTRDRSRSFGAVVATMDMRRSTKFFSAVSAHQNGEELSNNLSLNVVAALRQYRAIHKTLPDRILFYRDGVGEGQTNYVYQHELQNLLNNLKQFYGEQPVKLAFVIVSKRINTKFFATSGQGTNNVPAGTVVDDIVTLPERYDFFLVSQAVNQGTATPTNYNVIYDTFGLPPDKLQMMTFKMCHLYYNWSGTTRVPAVCQYAHKLAFLVGNFLHQAPANELSQYLYFL